MRKIRDVLRLSQHEGLSLRQVAASVQMPFTTVADHVRRARSAGLSWPLPEGLDDDALEALLFASAAPPADPRPLPEWQKVHVELRRPGVTLMLLWLEYREAFADGYSYSQFCAHYRRWQRRIDVVMRQEHKAGEKLFVDFPGQRIPIYDEATGEVALQAELFVAVLGASSYLFAEALASQELMHWVTAHVHAFEALGACPAVVVCDNLRSGVTRPHRYEPDVNATYSEMATHYGVAIVPARSYRPRDKELLSHCTSGVGSARTRSGALAVGTGSGALPAGGLAAGGVGAGATRDRAELPGVAVTAPLGEHAAAMAA